MQSIAITVIKTREHYIKDKRKLENTLRYLFKHEIISSRQDMQLPDTLYMYFFSFGNQREIIECSEVLSIDKDIVGMFIPRWNLVI